MASKKDFMTPGPEWAKNMTEWVQLIRKLREEGTSGSLRVLDPKRYDISKFHIVIESDSGERVGTIDASTWCGSWSRTQKKAKADARVIKELVNNLDLILALVENQIRQSELQQQRDKPLVLYGGAL